MATIIFDIDGTVADCSHRLHFITGAKKDWDSFFNSVDKDEVIPEMLLLYQALIFKHDIVFITGRKERCRRKTAMWLHTHGFLRYSALYMRADNDNRPDTEVKLDVYNDIKRYYDDIVLAVEDRQQVVDMWRSLGIRCLQCAPGKF